MISKENIDLLLRRLKKEGINKEDVAKRLGFNRTYLSDIIAGRKSMTEKFKKAFDQEFGSILKSIDAGKPIKIKKTLDQAASEYETRLLHLEINQEVFGHYLLEVVSKIRNEPIAVISAEMEKIRVGIAKIRLDELQQKQK